jgi:hypothetical protein
MYFDFYKQYQNYSNIDLLKIVKRPNDYQPNAVTVASQILNEREVTPDEIQLVEQYYQDIENNLKIRKEKIDVYKYKASDFLEPVLHPKETVEPSKWVNILLLIITIQYAWSLFNTIKKLISFFQCDYCQIDPVFFAELLSILYVPFIFYLLWRRINWGWIFLFADNLFSLISRLSQSYLFFKYQDIHHGDTGTFLFSIFIKAAFVVFLWRDSIASYFGVPHNTKKKTAKYTTIGTLAFIVLMTLLF